jgi:tRNA (guanine-N7-)-methyltransferase
MEKKSLSTLCNKETLSQFRGRHLSRPLRREQKERVERLLPSMLIPLHDAASYIHQKAQKFKALHLEIGFGGGEHLVERAQASPHVLHIGVEPFVNGVSKVLREVEERNLQNIILFTDDARLLLKALPSPILARVYILFADPWPKARHHKRRIVNHDILKELHALLIPQGELFIATDHLGYQEWMMEIWKNQPFFIIQKTYNRHPSTWPFTRYETKALKENASILYWEFIKIS